MQVAVTATAPDHEGSGVLELVQGTRVRRVPFWLRVDRPLLANKPFQTLRAFEARAGDTRGAGSVASVYRYPTNVSPLGLPTSFDGPEQLWRFQLGPGAVNAGVTIETANGVVAYPILMTQRDESHVAGESGLPLNVGPLPSRESIVPAAGIDAPAGGIWWVAVESPLGRAGRYRIRLWVSDVTAPRIHVLGQSFEHGRRVLRLHIVDTGSGVNPGGVTVAGGGMGHETVDFDEATGVATIDLSRLQPGRHSLRIQAPDLAETKDVLSASAGAANTATRTLHVLIPGKGSKGPALSPVRRAAALRVPAARGGPRARRAGSDPPRARAPGSAATASARPRAPRAARPARTARASPAGSSPASRRR